MRTKEFKELLAAKDPKRIIAEHTHLKIRLTDKQLDVVLKLKNKGNHES